jgi:hypothetical protein
MTVATLLLTCLIFLAIGMNSTTDAVLALSIGGVVCIAASNGGTTSQDLKTGFLVGGTPRLMQYSILIGALTSAVVIGGTLLLFNSAGTVFSQRVPPVNVSDQIPAMTETEVYEGETYNVWRPNSDDLTLPSLLEPGKNVAVKPGKYLVDEQGQVVYRVDPTITGDLKSRDIYVPSGEAKFKFPADDVSKLKTVVMLRGGVPDSRSGKAEFFRLWTNHKPEEEGEGTGEPYLSDVPEGSYLVTADGSVPFRVEGEDVKMKFKAPKTQVMGLIIRGLLEQKLNWGLVLIGAFVAVTLELCGVSARAFAVGVYIPIQYSTPIFMGGLVRFAVESWTDWKSGPKKPGAKSEGEVEQIAKSETSPGVLLASGLIAGGSLAGVLIAFLQFVPSVKKSLDFTKLTEGVKSLSWWSLLPFGLLMLLLMAAGAGWIFKPKNEEQSNGGTRP